MKLISLVVVLFCASALFGQSFVVRDIKSFGAKGDGKTNDHEAFRRAADFFNKRGGYGKLVISKGVYIIGKQVFNPNPKSGPVYGSSDALAFTNVKKLTVEGNAGSYVRYAKGLFYGAFDPATGKPYLHGNNYFVNISYLATIGSAISLTNCSDIVLRNLELDGNGDELVLGGVYGDAGIQIPHVGITVTNTTALTADKIHAHHFGLDGMMVGNATGDKPEQDKIVLSNSIFEYNARQGLSWIGGNDLTAMNCQFNHSGRGKFYSSPGAGLDIEAEIGLIKNGKFVKCQFINNTGVGMVADSGPSSNCTFTDCLFWGVSAWSIWINKPGFTIINSKIYGAFVHGYDAKTDAEATVFKNCLFEDKPYKGQEPFGTFLIETNYKRRVRFDDCTMIAHKKKIVWMESNPALSPEEKYQLNNCRLVFEGGISPAGNWVSLTRNIRYKNCTFELTHPEAKTKRFYFNGIGEVYNIDLGGNRYFVNKEERQK
jgi:hypothetical protein